jgi:Mg-chelatase subunit ChlD
MVADVDDAIRKHLESLKDQALEEIPDASEVVKEQNQAESEAEAIKEAKQKDQAAGKGLQKEILQAMSPYHREYLQISDALEKAHSRLVDVFEPERHFSWQKDQSSGPKLDVRMAMKFELTGEGYREMWMKRIDPKYPDMDVVILLDRSGSMELPEKYESAGRALIFAKELFARLHIRTACVGFANSPERFVDFDDDVADELVQQQIMQNVYPLPEGTNDAAAVSFAGELLRERPARHRAVIMLSDAGSGQPEDLKQVVAHLHSEGIPVLHFGLGAGTRDTTGNYILSWGDLSLTDMSEKGFLGVFCREMERLAEGTLELY